jgi:hypothetical protein
MLLGVALDAERNVCYFFVQTKEEMKAYSAKGVAIRA